MAFTEIDKPSDYFNTKLYTGTGATQSISGIGFAPDWVWIKERNGASGNIFKDTVRGATPTLVANQTNAESSYDAFFTSFDSDGFTLPSNGATNESSSFNYVSWNWLAGGTASSNTDGSITSNVSASTTSGFSIVSWTGNATGGATIGHGLGSVPKMIIIRNRTDVEDWPVYHGANTSAPETDYLVLNLTNATGDSSGVWNDTAPTSSVFSVGTANSTNGSSDNMIAYCFAEKKGFSRFGSYTGNGSTDGTFVYTGFKPAWFMVKKSSASGDSWVIIDNTRFPYNYVDKFIYADESDAESGSAERLDFLSNGIKIRATHPFINTSGATYIYMAFAENPFTTSTGIPTTAR